MGSGHLRGTRDGTSGGSVDSHISSLCPRPPVVVTARPPAAPPPTHHQGQVLEHEEKGQRQERGGEQDAKHNARRLLAALSISQHLCGGGAGWGMRERGGLG